MSIRLCTTLSTKVTIYSIHRIMPKVNNQNPQELFWKDVALKPLISEHRLDSYVSRRCFFSVY